MTLTIGIYIFDNAEVLDFAGPYEVFTTAARMHARSHESEQPLFRVATIGPSSDTVQARAGLKLDPDFTIEEHPKLDCLIVPGGVVTAELHRPQLIAWLNQQMQQVSITASVCTGAFLLAQTGRLDGLDVITHWEDISDLRAAFPMVQIKEGVRWTDNGAVVTSAGISAGIDMSLHLVERMADRALALRTAKQMDFEWKENQLHG